MKHKNRMFEVIRASYFDYFRNYIKGFKLKWQIFYARISFANFFLPLLTIRPSPSKALASYEVEISVTFSSATVTPPCCTARRASERLYKDQLLRELP